MIWESQRCDLSVSVSTEWRVKEQSRLGSCPGRDVITFGQSTLPKGNSIGRLIIFLGISDCLTFL